MFSMIYLAKEINNYEELSRCWRRFENEYTSPNDFLFIACKDNPFSNWEVLNFRGYIILVGLEKKIGVETSCVNGLELRHVFDNVYCLCTEGIFHYGDYRFSVKKDGIYIDGVNLFASLERKESKRLDYINMGSKYWDSYIYYPNQIGTNKDRNFELLDFLINFDGDLGPISEKGLPEFFYMTKYFNERKYVAASDIKGFKLIKYLNTDVLIFTYVNGLSEKVSGLDVALFLSCYKKYSSLPRSIDFEVVFTDF